MRFICFPRHVRLSSPALLRSQRFSFKIILPAEIPHETQRNCSRARAKIVECGLLKANRDRRSWTLSQFMGVSLISVIIGRLYAFFQLIPGGELAGRVYGKRIAQNTALLQYHFTTAYCITFLFRKPGVCRRLSPFFFLKITISIIMLFVKKDLFFNK